MTNDKLEKHEFTYFNEDRIATQKDLRILSLELEQKILELKIDLKVEIQSIRVELEQKMHSVMIRLGSLIVASSGILFGLLSYFSK